MRSTYTNIIILTGLLTLAAIAAAERKPLAAAKEEHMEPKVDRYAGVLPPSACAELIKLGEQSGFGIVDESIDDYQPGDQKVPSQSIEVYSYDLDERTSKIEDQPIWDALQPYMETFLNMVKKSHKDEYKLLYPDNPDREPSLDWIFFRKYSPDSDRNSLIPHVDTNVFTLNIALNDDFEGGGLFYVKPKMQEITSPDGRPNIYSYYSTYDWANTVQRGNTSDLVFPDLKAGDVLIHNFTVWHGVAPLDKGVRYSFVLFYDMDNPNIEDDYGVGDEDDRLDIEFYHEIEDVNIVVEFLEEDGTGEIMIEKLPAFATDGLLSYEGHKFRALVEGTGEVLAEFAVNKEQKRYVVVKKTQDSHDEL